MPRPSSLAAANGRKDDLTMAVITHTQLVKTTVDKAFDTIVDGANFAAWNPTIRSSRRLDSGPVGDGTRFEWDLRGYGKVVQELQEFPGPSGCGSFPTPKHWRAGTVSFLAPKAT